MKSPQNKQRSLYTLFLENLHNV